MAGEMSEIIYLIVSGEYSDYGVWCAFTDEARAKAYCAEKNATPDPEYPWRHGMAAYEYRVQPVDLDPPLPSDVKAVIQAS